MGDKRKFRIGQPVMVNLNHQVLADYDSENYRRVKRSVDWHGHNIETNERVLAIITGVKLFQEGYYNKGTSRGIFNPEDEYEAPYLSVHESITTWAVRLGYRNKEIYFFEKDMETIKSSSNIPYLYTGWNDHYKEKMSKESKDWPRDAKGRWSK